MSDSMGKGSVQSPQITPITNLDSTNDVTHNATENMVESPLATKSNMHSIATGNMADDKAMTKTDTPQITTAKNSRFQMPEFTPFARTGEAIPVHDLPMNTPELEILAMLGKAKTVATETGRPSPVFGMNKAFGDDSDMATYNEDGIHSKDGHNGVNFVNNLNGAENNVGHARSNEPSNSPTGSFEVQSEGTERTVSATEQNCQAGDTARRQPSKVPPGGQNIHHVTSCPHSPANSYKTLPSMGKQRVGPAKDGVQTPKNGHSKSSTCRPGKLKTGY